MLELRQRSRSRSHGSYSRLNTEEDIDDSPHTPLINRPGRPKVIPAPRSTLCKQRSHQIPY
ncbi:hypothetical protein EON63_13860 [archaeon]|nr:MAG: hypothetical protein EON63_13860 [archaeon]